MRIKYSWCIKCRGLLIRVYLRIYFFLPQRFIIINKMWIFINRRKHIIFVTILWCRTNQIQTLLRGTGGELMDSPGGRNLGSYIIVIGLFVQASFFWVLHFHEDQIYDVYSKEMSLLLEGIQKWWFSNMSLLTSIYKMDWRRHKCVLLDFLSIILCTNSNYMLHFVWLKLKMFTHENVKTLTMRR